MSEQQIMKRLMGVMVVVACVAVTVPLASAAGRQSGTAATAQPPTAGQSEFVPVNELPPTEQLPAAPLLIAAYAVAWLALLAYVWSIWRRLAAVERELTAVAKKLDSVERRP